MVSIRKDEDIVCSLLKNRDVNIKFTGTNSERSEQKVDIAEDKDGNYFEMVELTDEAE